VQWMTDGCSTALAMQHLTEAPTSCVQLLRPCPMQQQLLNMQCTTLRKAYLTG
jgi:hypothetical protein